MIKLEYFENVRDNTPRPLTIEILRQLIRSPWTRTCVEKFRSTGDDQWKRKLPGITWQATYPGGVRANVGAQCTGLFMLDVDHISKCHPLPGIREALNTPLQMYRETIAPRIDELNIVCVHGTASGDGIHVIACAREGLTTIHENQQWLAAQLGTPFDTACNDLARVGLISVPEDFFYLDRETLFDVNVNDNPNPNLNEGNGDGKGH